MVHNGIEYGLMAAYAEGLNILAHADAGTAARDADAETAPFHDAEFYRYDIDTRRWPSSGAAAASCRPGCST